MCRDFAHLAVAFCRCMNIPARYCTGYLGDIRIPPRTGPDGFCRLVRGLSRRALVHVRCAEQHAADWSRAASPVDATRPMWRSATPSVPTSSPVSRSGPTRSAVPSRARIRQFGRVHMRLLTVRHVTIYRYSEPVRFGEHRMMFRPRESHDLRLVSTKLDILPRPSGLRWLHDVFDNSVAIATFDERRVRASFRQHGHARAQRDGAARLCARGRGAELSVSLFGRRTARSHPRAGAPVSGRRPRRRGRRAS